MSDGEEPPEPKDNLIVNQPEKKKTDIYQILTNPAMNQKRKP